MFTSKYSASALFQCQHSTHQDGQVFIPNIPDLYFDHVNTVSMLSSLIQTMDSATYFFTIPPESAERNCSGTVVAIQYCYRVPQNLINSAQLDVFLFHSVTRDGFVFTVNSSFTVRATPHLESECTRIFGLQFYLCCDTATLSAENQLSISPESYTFGITIINANQVISFAFGGTAEFVAEQFQGSLGVSLRAGSSYELEASKQTNGLLLMRFLIGKCYRYVYIHTAKNSTSMLPVTSNIPVLGLSV